MSERTPFRVAWEARDQVASAGEQERADELLDEALGALSGDELDIVGLVIERLGLGSGIYGQWEASAETRDLLRESLEEELDDVVYRAMRTVRSRRTGLVRLAPGENVLWMERQADGTLRFARGDS